MLTVQKADSRLLVLQILDLIALFQNKFLISVSVEQLRKVVALDGMSCQLRTLVLVSRDEEGGQGTESGRKLHRLQAQEAHFCVLERLHMDVHRVFSQG